MIQREMDFDEIEETLRDKHHYEEGEVSEVMPKLRKIDEIRKEKSAIILAHYYQIPPIQLIADIKGDSLKLAQAAKEIEDKKLVVCSTVVFMAEMVKLLSPDKKVVVPSLEAGCSIASGINGESVRKIRERFPGSAIVAYVNTYADTKAEVDSVCTSANAKEVLRNIKGNPVLTDILLDFIEEIPRYSDNGSEKRGRTKNQKTRHVSQFAIDNAAEKLAALSDKRMLHYIDSPRAFSSEIGSILGSFNDVMEKLRPHYKAILEMPHIRIIAPDSGLINLLKEPDKNVQGTVKKIMRVDLDTIIQDKDSVLPDNKREKDFFALREKLLKGIYNGMQELSEIGEIDQREEEAAKIIRGLVGIKSEMIDVAMTEKVRKLRQDKSLDNEYYVGRQQGHGQFYFERKPVPNVKLDDVIGESFDTAKRHLMEITETGRMPRVMKLSAPGGKVKSNILLIGPYGCGKTELARAVCSDKRVIGASVSVANTLTAYMHESVNNVKRIYDQAVELRTEARDLKPVVLVLDEFDGWFANGHGGNFADVDMQQIQDVFLEVLDGMEDYSGIVTLAMTNKPKEIPAGIMRRFRYVDIVGKLNQEEREKILGLYLEKRMPVRADVPEHYAKWAEKLDHAPGDVIRKVVDELHFEIVPEFIRKNSRVAERLERTLYGREKKNGALDDKDIIYLRSSMQKYGIEITPEQVDKTVDDLLLRPVIQQQINRAKQVYEDAETILQELKDMKDDRPRFGFRTRSELFDVK